MSGRSKAYESKMQAEYKVKKPKLSARKALPKPEPPPRYVPPAYVKLTGAEYERIFDGLFEQGVLK